MGTVENRPFVEEGSGRLPVRSSKRCIRLSVVVNMYRPSVYQNVRVVGFPLV